MPGKSNKHDKHSGSLKVRLKPRHGGRRILVNVNREHLKNSVTETKDEKLGVRHSDGTRWQLGV